MRKKTIKKFIICILTPGIVFCWCHFLLAADEIHEAAAGGDLKRVMEILKKDPNALNQPDQNGRTPLHHATIVGNNQVAEYLIKQGADLDPQDEFKSTPLHNAAVTGNLELVKMLLEKGSKSINQGATWNNTPLHMACERGYPEVVSFLLDKGADIEARNGMKRTPLIAAARERGDLKVIKILVDRGADIHAQDISNDTALTLAAWRGFEDVVNYLIEKKSKIPESNMRSVLWFAAEKNLYRLYEYLLENGMEIKKLKAEMQTLIHSSAAGGSIEIIKSLIKQGFDPAFQDEDGWSPLHYAASQGKTEMIEYLIKIGIDKDCRNKKGETAYHLAVFREFPEAAQKLKDLGVDSSSPDFPELKGPYMGQTPPGKTPEMFLPGIVSGHYDQHSTIVFSPDGKEACWTEMYPPREKGYGTGGVMMMKMVKGRWTYPEKSTVMDGEPFFSPDGKRLYFISEKPLPGQEEGGKENIWYMTKTSTGWSEPVPVDNVINSMELHWQFSLDKKGNLYFADWNRIFFAENDKGTYKKPVDISELYNNPTLKGFCPFISPDGNYLLFSAPKQEGGRNIDLYVSFKKKDGSWTDRIHLGDEVNASMHDICAYVSPDEKYLFFTSVGQNRPWGIYWVDNRIIKELRQAWDEERKQVIKNNRMQDVDFPLRFDWRDRNILTPVRHQLNLGSCGVFAAVAVFESLIKKETGKSVDLSEQQIINGSQDFVPSGISSVDAMKYIKQYGLVLEERLSYEDKKTEKMPDGPPDYILTDYHYIQTDKLALSEKIKTIKQSVLKYGPVATNMLFYQDLDRYKGGIYIYDGKSEEQGGHWVVIIGWQDDPEVKNGGYWICRNSWGDKWGEKGYFNIAYGECGIDDFWYVYGIFNP